MSNTVSRVLYQTIIYLGLMLPSGSSNLPGTRRAAVLFLFGLASDGVYSRRLCYQRRGEPLPHLFTLTSTKLAVLFCCTSLRVASTGRYPASCPVKPGLSSPAAFQRLQPRLSVLLIVAYFSIRAPKSKYRSRSAMRKSIPWLILPSSLFLMCCYNSITMYIDSNNKVIYIHIPVFPTPCNNSII